MCVCVSVKSHIVPITDTAFGTRRQSATPRRWRWHLHLGKATHLWYKGWFRVLALPIVLCKKASLAYQTNYFGG